VLSISYNHGSVLETSSVMNSMKAHQEGSFNEVPSGALLSNSDNSTT